MPLIYAMSIPWQQLNFQAETRVNILKVADYLQDIYFGGTL